MKRRRVVSFLLALVLLCSLSLIPAMPVGAVTGTGTVWYVAEGGTGDGSENSPFGKIQDAVNAASSGDTIQVAAGTYEEIINIPKNKGNLIFYGAKQGIPAGPDKNPANRGTGESIIKGGFNPTQNPSGWVVIDGFTIESSVWGTIQAEDGMYLRGGGHTVVNNILIGSPPDGQTPTNYQSGIKVQHGQENLIAYNNIQGYKTGVWVDGGSENTSLDPPPAGSVIEYNYISGANKQGIIFGDSLWPGHETRGNVIEDSATGIVIAQGGHIIENNIIRNIDDAFGTASIPEGSGAAIVIEVVDRWGKRPAKDIQITGNDLLDNDMGIAIIDKGGQHESVINNVARNNTITGNGTGIVNQVTSEFNARKNWWGHASGPSTDTNPNGLGDAISGNVAYSPWYTSENMDETVSNSPVYNVTQDNGYNTIQAAIDDASDGDTIQLAAETFEEDIQNGLLERDNSDGKKVSLVGTTDESGNPLTIIRGSVSYGLDRDMNDNIRIENINFVVDTSTILRFHGVNGATIQNCTFDGDGRFSYTGNSDGAWLGIVFERGSANGNSDVLIDGCTFQNGLYTAVQGYFDRLTVENCTITNISNGINHQGGSNLEVKDTDIDVIARSASDNTYAIRFGSSTVTNMTVDGGSISVDYNGLTPDSGVYFAAIVIRNPAAGTLKANNLSIDGEVINFTTTNLDATSNWWGHASGPQHATTNPTGLGSAVSDHVTFTPWLLVSPDEIEDEETVETTGAGGTKEFEGAGVTVDMPDDVDGTVTVTTALYSVPADATNPLPADVENARALKYVDVKLEDTTYTGNVRITISYDEAELARLGIDEETLKLYYFKMPNGPWTLAVNQALDTVNNKVSGDIPASELSGTPLCLGGEVTITGQYKVGAPPAVTVTFTPAEMDPTVEQTVTVGVSIPEGEGRTLAELTGLTFKVWYDADGGDPDETEFNNADADVQECAIITWNNTDGFELDSELSGTTWSLGTCTAPSDLNVTSGDFILTFTPGKVAKQTFGMEKWQLAAAATSEYGTGFGFDAEGAMMNWYGEVVLGSAVNVDWGSVPAGMDFNNGKAKQSLGTIVTYISNGEYRKLARSSATWSGVTYTADLNAAGNPGSNEFSIKAYNSDDLTNAKLLDSTGTFIENITVGTDESGDSDTNNYLWLKLGSPFNQDTYSGTITYIIDSGALR